MNTMDMQQADDDHAKSLVDQFGIYDCKLDLARYHYPTLDLLDSTTGALPVTVEELDSNKETIVHTLHYAGIKVTQIKATIGPRLTLYEIIPAPGVRISQVMGMESDLALRLGMNGVKVIGALAGKGTIGIEVPHLQPAIVTLRSVLATEKFLLANMALPLALGRTMDNEPFLVDLAKLPHLLIAGATGQGKSVAINAILASLLYKKHPAELKLILIDFNRLELSPFRKIERHFLAKLPEAENAVISNISSAVETLTALTIELDQRYELFGHAQVRNVQEYNQKYVSRRISDPERHRYLPYIVVIIDEFADLVTSANSAQALITRIAQLGRSAGIHLVISTQRPSVNVITGDIKANFITRLAFRVATSIDSRTIIDNGGAEKLKGEGDMLYYAGNQSVRLQGALVTTDEIAKLVDFIGLQPGYPSAMYLPEPLGDKPNPKEFDPGALDPFFVECATLVVLYQQGSTSLIQRKLKLGYNRAGRIIDQLEAAQIIGPFDGSKAREVLFPDEQSLHAYLKTLVPGQALSAVQELKEPEIKLPTSASVEQPRKRTFFERLFKF